MFRIKLSIFFRADDVVAAELAHLYSGARVGVPQLPFCRHVAAKKAKKRAYITSRPIYGPDVQQCAAVFLPRLLFTVAVLCAYFYALRMLPRSGRSTQREALFQDDPGTGGRLVSLMSYKNFNGVRSESFETIYIYFFFNYRNLHQL